MKLENIKGFLMLTMHFTKNYRIHVNKGELSLESAILNIKPVKHETYNCYFNNIITGICSYFSKEVSLCFLDSFSFKLIEQNDSYTIHCFTDNFEFIMENMCGIKIINSDVTNMKDALLYIKQQIDDALPVGLLIDSYHLPWNIYYLKLYMPHSILIIGYDEEYFYCVDGFLSEKIETIKKENLIKNGNELIAFKNISDVHIDKNEIIGSLKKTVESYSNINAVKKYLDLYMEQEMKDGIDIRKSKTMYHISNIGWSRNNFSSSLQFVKTRLNTDIFDNIICDVNYSYEKWIVLKNLLSKSLLLKNKNMFDVKSDNIISDISKHETDIVNMILSL